MKVILKTKLGHVLGRRHTSAQLATAYYKFGMVGVGKRYSTLITAASGDCNPSEKQIKVV